MLVESSRDLVLTSLLAVQRTGLPPGTAGVVHQSVLVETLLNSYLYQQIASSVTVSPVDSGTTHPSRFSNQFRGILAADCG